jgi:peptide/nickel transport system substrate-binding protein
MGRIGRVFVVSALFVGVGACAGGDDGAGPPSATGNTTTTNPDAGLEPVYGGTLRYGVDSDTSSPWTPAQMGCGNACHITIRSVYDTLTVPDEAGAAQPNLLESFEANEDFTEWTLTARAGVEFHDGTPFDGEAIEYNLEALVASPLAGAAVADITEVTSDGMTATVSLSRPVPALPAILSTQLGYVASPSWLRAVEAGTAEPDEPVGTGPFVFESYEPGGTFAAVRNEDYWKTDAEGRELPYLDRVEFVIQEQVATRVNALVSGETEVMHTQDGDSVARLRREAEDGAIEVDEFTQNNDTAYVLLHSGDPESPLHDRRVRRALAMAFDAQTYIEARSGGVTQEANGPFPPGSAGHLDDTGHPQFDPEAAADLVAEWEAENGPLEVSLSTNTDEANLTSAQLVEQFWEEVGVDVELDRLGQGDQVIRALQGDFQATLWSQHAGFDPVLQWVWWHGRNAVDPPALALNFGRIRDDVIDENLDVIIESDDDAERTAAAEAVNRRFGEQVYELWYEWRVWSVAHRPEVHNVTGATTPAGEPVLANEGGGLHQIAQIWLDPS